MQYLLHLYVAAAFKLLRLLSALSLEQLVCIMRGYAQYMLLLDSVQVECVQQATD